MQVKKISVKRHINLPDGQGMEIVVTGCAEAGIDTDLAKLSLLNVLNSGVVTVLINEIVKPIEEKFRLPVQKQVLEVH